MITIDALYTIWERDFGSKYADYIRSKIKPAYFGLDAGIPLLAPPVLETTSVRSPWPLPSAWPMQNSEKLAFIGQIYLSELPVAGEDLAIFPEIGVLQFFSVAGDELWGASRPDNGFVCFYDREPVVSGCRSIVFERGFTLDAYEPADFQLYFESLDANVYFDARDRLKAHWPWLIQVLGFEDPVQDKMTKELESLRPNCEWVLLACFNAETKEMGPAFGRYFFWIDKADLRAREFHKSIMIFQA